MAGIQFNSPVNLCRTYKLDEKDNLCHKHDSVMALITISGFPSSGKSRRAGQLKAHLERRLQDPSYTGPQLKVVLISDHALNIDRAVYGGL